MLAVMPVKSGLRSYGGLPSIKSQTCQEFTWIVLIDSTTPERFKDRIVKYQRECKQLIPVYVEPEKGRCFAEIFREEVVKRLRCKGYRLKVIETKTIKNLRMVEFQHRKTRETRN